MSVLAIVQSRLGSTRLPNKALLDICGKTMIQHVVDRAQAIRQVDHVIVAVPVGDRAVHPIAVEVPGDPMDVLGRFAHVSALCHHETILRVTGDCPLLDPAIADAVIDLYRQTPGCEYAWNVTEGYVDGEDVEVFSAAALQRAHREATDPADREHVTPWLRRHVQMATLQPAQDRRGLKTSVDTYEDLVRVRALMEGRCPPR